jgi:DNA modification methylase
MLSSSAISSLPALDVRVGDCRELMREMPDESVQCCVTSPPYWGLRDYGNAGQIGQEETPELFVKALVDVFREVRRVLKADGTCWVNLGASYARQGSDSYATGKGALVQNQIQQRCKRNGKPPAGYKHKDMIPTPWMLAIGMQADGWYLRQDIIWHKPAPTPESVTDRCTRSHEYIFLLSKSPKYYYNAKAIAEPTRNKPSVWSINTHAYPEAHFATYPPDLIKPCILAGTKCGDVVLDPFGGSGTTGQVALELGRRAILCELNEDYAQIIHQRTNVTMGLAL